MSGTTGMRGTHVVVDGEALTIEDTVKAAVCAGRLSPDLLDHGFDTYRCVTEDGHHRSAPQALAAGAPRRLVVDVLG
jgi:hypothetical protein